MLKILVSIDYSLRTLVYKGCALRTKQLYEYQRDRLHGCYNLFYFEKFNF